MVKQAKLPTPPEVQTVAPRTVYQRLHFVEILLLILIVSFGVLMFFAKTNPYFPFDLVITKTIQEIAFSWFDSLMRLISKIGNADWGTFFACFFGLCAFFYKRYKDSFFIILSTGGAAALALLLKNIVNRPRPDPELIHQVGKFLNNDSFPSGHVLHYMGLYGFLLFLSFTHIKNKTLRYSLTIILGIMLLLIGLSRIYLGAHWFSDTLGAYLVGSIWLFAVVYFYHHFHYFKNN